MHNEDAVATHCEEYAEWRRANVWGRRCNSVPLQPLRIGDKAQSIFQPYAKLKSAYQYPRINIGGGQVTRINRSL